MRHAAYLLATVLVIIFSALRVSGQMVPDEVCVGTTKHYWVDPTAGSTYTWMINGVPQVSTTNEIDILWDLPYTPAGSPYTISVQEKSAAGCYGPVRSGLVTIHATAAVNVFITPGQNPSCAGTPVTFTSTVTNGGTNPTYKWFVNAAFTGATTATYTYTPAAGDIVTCEVTSDALCATNNPAMSAPVVMQTGGAPIVTFTPCFDLITSVEAKPFKLRGGLPLGGTYSGGAGVNSPTPGMFDPSVAPAGPVPVTYTYTNAAGCSGSAVVSIQNNPAPSPAFVCGTGNWTDIRDNRSYPTILIGTQCWLAANLDYGTVIPSSQVQTDNCVNEKYCYNNLTTAGNCQGGYGFYQWDEMMSYDNTPESQGVCPPGWHIPSETEWTVLFNFYQGVAFAGRPLQDTNPPGFHALPSGVLYMNDTWSFKDLATIFWSSTPIPPVKAVSHGMNTIDNSVSYYESLRVNAFPVRCVKN